jgi:hypothetical protein
LRIYLAPLPAALTIASTIWCGVVGYHIWVTPVAGSASVWATGEPSRHVTSYRDFADVSYFGPAPLILPAALAMLATWAALRDSKRGLSAAAVIFGVFVGVTGFSIGSAYAPAAWTLIVAAVLTWLEPKQVS